MSRRWIDEEPGYEPEYSELVAARPTDREMDAAADREWADRQRQADGEALATERRWARRRSA